MCQMVAAVVMSCGWRGLHHPGWATGVHQCIKQQGIQPQVWQLDDYQVTPQHAAATCLSPVVHSL